MGMPITVEIVNDSPDCADSIEQVFDYFHQVDVRFSPYKPESEVSKINDGLKEKYWSPEMKEVINLCRETSRLTAGYFDITINGKIDPSGLVKGWSIYKASQILAPKYKDYYIEAGGDIEVSGRNSENKPWQIGIRNPIDTGQIVKTISLSSGGIATSGTYIRGNHIYNPKTKKNIDNPISLTVIGPNIYESDRFATAAFAMGLAGINLIEKIDGLEGYMIDKEMLATKTSNFERYEI